MLDPLHFTILAGAEVVANLRKDQDHNSDVPITTLQERAHADGYRGAEVVYASAKGCWTLRFATGLENFDIIKGDLPSYGEAVKAAWVWQAEDQDKRYVFVRNSTTQAHA